MCTSPDAICRHLMTHYF